MKIQSHSRIDLTAFVVASLFFGAAGCGGAPGGHGPDGGIGGAAGAAGRGGNSSAGGSRDGGLAGGGGAAGGNGAAGGTGNSAGIGGAAGSAGIGGAAGSAGIGGAAGSAGIGGTAGSAGVGGTAGRGPDGGATGVGGTAGRGPDGGATGVGGTAGRGIDGGAAGSGGSRDAASDKPLDSGHDTGGGADSGAGNDADVSGDAAAGTCPGTGASGPLPAFFNCSTNGQNCGLCLQALEGDETVCATCSTAQLKSNCLALLTCLGRRFFDCVGSGNGIYCYCTDSSCSMGANGTCVAPIQAVAGTTDSVEILRQIQDPSTIVGGVVKEAERFHRTAACDQFCGCAF